MKVAVLAGTQNEFDTYMSGNERLTDNDANAELIYISGVFATRGRKFSVNTIILGTFYDRDDAGDILRALKETR
jgi:hypothetical protein